LSKQPRDCSLSESQTYFLTFNTWNGRSIFQVHHLCDLFLSTLENYRTQQKFSLHEFVIMPNHIHLLLSPLNEITVERSVLLIKGGFSFRAGKEVGLRGEIWQRGYVDHRVRDARDYAYDRQYIHQNPIRAGLVSSIAEFAFSSVNTIYVLDPVPQGLKPDSRPSYGTTEVVPSRLRQL
jgi:putative transposase